VAVVLGESGMGVLFGEWERGGRGENERAGGHFIPDSAFAPWEREAPASRKVCALSCGHFEKLDFEAAKRR